MASTTAKYKNTNKHIRQLQSSYQQIMKKVSNIERELSQLQQQVRQVADEEKRQQILKTTKSTKA